jgi:hypothetical protein
MEGVNGVGNNKVTLHTGPTCNMPTATPSDCNANQGRTGCGVNPTGSGNFGASFNNARGGVYALEWQNSNGGFIKYWFFPRNAIPADIQQNQPSPSKWGKEQAFFPFGANCAPNNFKDQRLVINLTFCGDWAGAVFAQQCSWTRRSCVDYIRDPSTNLGEAYFKMNYVKVFTRQ